MTATVTPLSKFIPDDIVMSAPQLPTHRPATKGEVWEHYKHIYGQSKKMTELVDFARGAWAWDYVQWVNFAGWRKQPDWMEGDEIIPDACPTGPFEPGPYHIEIERLYQTARQLRRRAA